LYQEISESLRFTFTRVSARVSYVTVNIHRSETCETQTLWIKRNADLESSTRLLLSLSNLETNKRNSLSVSFQDLTDLDVGGVWTNLSKFIVCPCCTSDFELISAPKN
jgi:hypothetical protein